ncbi:hypothetical protein BGC07_01825 [Piscirickettsia litoralis]|uniref:Uncharacterized protein n=2 Tax=Piscirickettsia litoralis TaxID=1891921 RepID=A0ABX3A2R0_9GAMM|nr:hypothetical protein BGC07_01825 [Piscirickettsia litoralis]
MTTCYYKLNLINRGTAMGGFSRQSVIDAFIGNAVDDILCGSHDLADVFILYCICGNFAYISRGDASAVIQ